MSTDPIVNDAIAKLVSTAKDVIGDGKVSFTNILILVVNFMRTVEGIPKMTGQQKKSAVITSVVAVMKATGSDTGLLEIIPSFIDIVIGVNNNGLVFQPVVLAQTCCSALCSKCPDCKCPDCKCPDCCKKQTPPQVEMK